MCVRCAFTAALLLFPSLQEKFGEPGVGVPGGGGGSPCSTVLREAKSYMGLKEQNISALTPRHSQQVGQLLRQLQASDGVRLAGLQGTSLSTAGLDYVGLLREIADEQSFEVTYVPIEELSPDGGFLLSFSLLEHPHWVG